MGKKISREILDLQDQMDRLCDTVNRLSEISGFCAVMGYDEKYIDALDLARHYIQEHHWELYAQFTELTKERDLKEINNISRKKS